MGVKVEFGSALGEGRAMRGSIRDNGRKRGGPRHIVSREKEETKKRYCSGPSVDGLASTDGLAMAGHRWMAWPPPLK